MTIIQNQCHWIENNGDILRQYIDARSVFTALEEARKNAEEVRGGMHWKQQGKNEYLIRTSVKNAQKSLGPRSAETEAIYQKFIELKASRETRVAELSEALERHQRMNRALYVGNVPRRVVDILNILSRFGLSDHFVVVGNSALYAYEAAAGARFIEVDAIADSESAFLWEPRKRLSFVTQMEFHWPSFLTLLQKADSTFKVRSGQPYSAVNSKGFVIDVVRAEVAEGKILLLNPTGDSFESCAVLANRVGDILNEPRISLMIVARSGHMARMNAISPMVFAKYKRLMAELPNRDSMTRQRETLQAELVEELVEYYHLAVL